MNNPIRILLVDDSPYFIEAAREFLAMQEPLTVVDVAKEEQEALAKSLESVPDVILLDLNLAHGSGLELIPAFRGQLPNVKIIVLTMMDEDGYRAAAFQAGADGFVHKTAMSKTLVSAILETMGRGSSSEAVSDHVPGGGEQNEARFLHLAEHLPDLIYRYEFAPKRGFTYVNSAATTMTGYTPEEHYADPDLGFKLVHPDDHPLLEAMANGKMDMQKPLVLRWVRKDGGVFWAEQRNVPIFDANGALIACEGVARDITERMRAEWALRESEDRFRRLFEQTHDAVFILNLEGRHLAVNQRAADMLDYSPDEIMGLSVKELSAEPAQSVQVLQRLTAGERIPLYERLFRKRGGEIINVEINLELARDARGNPLHIQSVVRDITGRKQAERALHDSQAQMQGIIASAMDAIITIDEDQRIVIFNPAAEQMFKCPASEAIGSSLERFIPDYFRVEHEEAVRAFGKSNATRRSMETPTLNLTCLRADGESYPSEVSISQSEFDGQKLYTAIVRDITERRRAEVAVATSQRLLQDITDNSASLIYALDQQGKFLLINRRLESVLGSPRDTLIGKTREAILPPDIASVHRENDMQVVNYRQSIVVEEENDESDGKHTYLSTKFPLLDNLGNVYGVGGVSTDITERKQAEEKIHASEDRYRDLVENIHDLIGLHDLQGNILSINSSASKLLGFENETLLKMNLRDLLAPEVRYQFDNYLETIQKDGQARGLMLVQTANGERRIWEYSNSLRSDSVGGPVVRALARDVTEQKQAEEAMRESEARYRAIFDGVQDAILVESPDGRILEVNDRACEMHGYTRAEMLTKAVTDLVPQGHAILMADDILQSAPMETINRRANGETFPIEISGRLQTINEEEVLLVVVRDITARKQAEEKIQLQVQRLSALKEIDHTIASTVDMRLSLGFLLSQAVAILAVDAAAILLLDPALNVLHYAAGLGFRSRAVETAEVKLGDSHAGQAALNRRRVQIPDLANDPDNPLLTRLLKEDRFVSYYGVPLIVKGKVIGVLETFHRSIGKRDQEWLDFLETLAGQAAIAIDNAQSFERIQTANAKLTLAYDATIEGWSRAMDLRDKETEGHTQRVTALTLDLARALDIPQAEMVHIRRGALLHDIGKLGVPDSILLKPDKLTDEEWGIMRQHPTFAYEMLTPIDYLEPALDIPYCHHEKWDGTGYPRGLKGEEIPLAARFFALVDVYDALRSDRPYREAWTEAKTLAYIREQSGYHFDPQVVEHFIKMIKAT